MAARSPGVAGKLTQQALPVRRVVLFQNGVAYFERRGEFTGDELTLKVRPSQIQDILKSITVVDFSGGRANSMALPVDVSSDKALAELPRQALGQGSLGDILRALRGAPVFLDTEDGAVEGRLVGIDPGGKDNQQRISVMDESGTIHLVKLEDVEALRILDTTLAKGLIKGLDISLGKEAWRSVDMKIFLNKGAQKKHNLMISYLTEMPTWKSTYRLVLGEDKNPLLQGWAIVDNVSGADWNDVKLTLTTGSPVSFRYNLYTPRFVQRPDLTPYRSLGIPPPVAASTQTVTTRTGWAGAEREKKKRSEAPASLMAGRSRRAAPAKSLSKDMAYLGDGDVEQEPEPEATVGALYDSMRVQSVTQKIGSLYRFDLSEPMTVPDRSSTMIALINTKVPGRAIYSYNPESGIAAARNHPFRAVHIRNQAGSVLEPGPISIVRKGQFVGEGLINRIEKGQDSYIAYALDTAVNVTHNLSSSQETIGLIKIYRGVIQTKSFSIQRHVFEVMASKEDGEALPLMVSIPKRSGWKTEVQGGEAESETADLRYFSMQVEPGKKTMLEIKEKYPSTSSYQIFDNAAQQALIVYISAKDAKREIVVQLEPLVKKVRQLSDTRSRIQTLELKRSDLQQRAAEIRSNLKLLKRSRNLKLKQGQQQRLMAADRKLSRLTDQLVTLRDKAAELRVELSTLIEKLEIDF
ncbi:MAG TPA: DUF4139 domain-containing protein [Myxococcota bacterium]|nr:DUF4139 domain-containing protein [Myxococcota bacterium]